MSSSLTSKKKHKYRHSKSPFPFPFPEPSSNLFPSKHEIIKLFVVIAIAASIAFACNYIAVFFNRQPMPFCDSGELSQFSSSEFCEPCPENGYCSDGELVCSHGYKKHGRKCLEDGDINQIANKLSEWLEDHICNAHAQDLCDKAGIIWFPETDVMKLLDEHGLGTNIDLKSGAFALAKKKVMKIIERSLEKRVNFKGNVEFKCPDLRAKLYKPLLCTIRQGIYEHYFLVASISAVILGIVKFLWRLRQRHHLSTRAEQLYEQVCEILEDNAMMVKSMKNEGDPWVIASWLRDHLLHPKERRDAKLWKKVEELLLEDSRIDQYPKLIKGESKIVLEWQVDGSLSEKMRAKRAISKTKPGSHLNLSPSNQQREANMCT